MHHAQNLIAGRFVPAAGGRVDDDLCPADGAFLGTAPRSSRADAEAAVEAARGAFPAWEDTPAPLRGDILFRAARLLEARAEELARTLALEEGKVLADARGEVGKTLRYLVFAAGDARRLHGITAPSELPGTLAYTYWRPRGVVGLITPWNFPLCIPVWKLAPALVAGNTVVLKPAPETPLTADLVARIFVEAGLPPGVLNVVHGDADPAAALLDHPGVAAISFTGSTEVGRIVERRCAETHKAVQCELGGKNPILVLDDADVELAARAAALGAFGSTGQRCTATSRAIVMEAVADDFVEGVSRLASEVVAGHPLDPAAGMGPAVSLRQLEKVLSFRAVGDEEGAHLAHGGDRMTEGPLGAGFFPRPTVWDRVRADSRIAREEIFGPVLSVIRVSSVDEAVAAANAIEFGLTSSVFTRDLGRAFECVRRLDSGMTQVNAPTVGGEGHLPFGGVKATGTGPREMGPDAWKFYAEQKTVYVNHGGAARTSRIY